MCVAVSGKVVEINGKYAKADIMGNTCDIYAGLVNMNIGDCVLIHAGCAIEIVKPELAAEINDLYSGLSGIVS